MGRICLGALLEPLTTKGEVETEVVHDELVLVWGNLFSETAFTTAEFYVRDYVDENWHGNLPLTRHTGGKKYPHLV